MLCRMRYLIDDYLSQTLESAQRADFEQHMEHCTSCRQGLAAAREAHLCLGWLAMEEAPPQPGPNFYDRVRQSIEREQRSSWTSSLKAAKRWTLAYPVVALCLLLIAWSLTFESRASVGVYDGLTETEYPAAEFSQMSFSRGDQARELVMITLVGAPE